MSAPLPAPALARVQSFTFSGIHAVPVTVEVQISSGLPAFLFVGLADKAVGEARERVKAALSAMGLSLPPKRILVNLTPANLLKEGAHFDVPIAVGLLIAMGLLDAEALSEYAAVGELSLDGRLNAVQSILSASLGAAEHEIGLICPASQASEARWGNSSHDILAPQTLAALIAHFRGEQVLPTTLPTEQHVIDYGADLAFVKGMPLGRRALEIAAAGGHSILLSGPPGTGKSMLAACLPSILPHLTPEETLETSRIYSASGMLEGGQLIVRPPYRAPHHSASLAALIGGGAKARPGEVSLSHHGVLFLDELPEFARNSLEALRQPLETGSVTISRAAHHATYPARFQLIAAMNPCRCGYMGDPRQSCRKAPRCGDEYTNRISGPMMDRIDLFVTIDPLPPAVMSRLPDGESSAAVRPRVQAARKRQTMRQKDTNAHSNPDSFFIDDDARSVIEHAAERLSLSNRGMTRLMRVSRTIADLEGTKEVQRHHVTEALSFRRR
ncbi:magnesium chelatase-related protein [Neokomagataea thailandica NBRC 106555]|uniref:ATP-binding protein n=2 Tax=Neokomagataea TaxID=1223423 RepID=A0A4Y6V5M2_9PROT|nr:MULTISPECIES: YifB family Mg chelatase-like AAA ATPase [Neokomagataea]QDH23970.1 ATP-binding protein [Neokomagataea tanensis]GBR54602.1 magnesium chelatase-related protein [Neokomagataea thailandica NBRC 106555]